MDRKFLIILAVGVVVMGVTGYVAYPSRPPEIPVKERRYMHCRRCGLELAWNQKLADGGCPRCGPDQPFTATKESALKEGGLPSPAARMVAPLLIEANLLIFVLLLYYSFRRKQETEEVYLYMECDHCTQRLRYRPERAGRVGQCPRCKHRLVFLMPPEDDDDLTLPWWKPRRWWAGLKRGWAVGKRRWQNLLRRSRHAESESKAGKFPAPETTEKGKHS